MDTSRQKSEEDRDSVSGLKPAKPDASTDKSAAPYQRKRQRSRSRLEAIIIRPAEGNTSADVLALIRSMVSPSDSEASVRELRGRRSCDVLVELSTGTESKARIGDALYLGRNCPTMGYYVTQLLSSHGYFPGYLHKMANKESPD